MMRTSDRAKNIIEAPISYSEFSPITGSRLELRKLDPSLVPDGDDAGGDGGPARRTESLLHDLTQVFASVGLLLATPRQVLAHVATNGVAIVVAGLALGSITAFIARKLIAALIVSGADSSQAFGATPFALAAAAVATAVGAALLIGALRAMRLDPIQALREL